MAENVNKEAEEIKNKRLQLETRGEVDIELRMHFRLIFGFDKGKLYWKAKKQDVMINSFTTTPGFNLELLGVKPTYRRDEDDTSSVMNSNEVDIAKESPYLLESVNNSLKTILNNSRASISRILMAGVKNSLQVADRLNSYQYKRNNSLDSEKKIIESKDNEIFNKIENFLTENKEYESNDSDDVSKYLVYLSLFDSLNEAAEASSEHSSPYNLNYIILDGTKYCIVGPKDRKYNTYSAVQVMDSNGTAAKFMVQKIKSIEEDKITSSLRTKSSDDVRKTFIDTLYASFVKGKGTNLFGNISPENVTEDDKKKVDAGTIDPTMPFYQEVDAVVNAFEKNIKHAFETITDVSDDELHDQMNGEPPSDESGTNEDYWETDDIYSGITGNYPMIEAIKRKSYIEVVVDNVRIRRIIKASEMFEINDAKISGSPDKILYRFTGKSIGQNMRERVEAGQTRIYINYQEYHPNQAAAFLSYIMPDLIFITARTPNNTLGKIRRFLQRGVNPIKGTSKKLEDTAVAAKVKNAVRKK